MNRTYSGQQIGPYTIYEAVGKGGMSRVYRALDESKDREVAIKIMTESAAADEDYLHRFQLEIDIASRLDHPHILPVLDWGRTDDGAPFLVMPFAERGTLNDILRRGIILTPYQAWRVAFQIADALDYAHGQGIIHRDVKPHNIMVVDEGTFALADFGLVKLADSSVSLTQSGSLIGSPCYMSPEQARSRAIDRRSDVYSLGIVLYECLVGRLPYHAETPLEMIGQHLIARPILPSQISPEFPPEIEAVLMRALVKDREARYPSAGDLARTLGTLLTELPEADQNRPLVSGTQVHASNILQNEPVTLILKPERARHPTRHYVKRWGGLGAVVAAGLLVAGLALQSLVIRPLERRAAAAEMTATALSARLPLSTSAQAGSHIIAGHGVAPITLGQAEELRDAPAMEDGRRLRDSLRLTLPAPD